MFITFLCPDCKRSTHRVDASRSATLIVDRKCRRCGSKWRFKITPLSIVKKGVADAHMVEATSKF